MMKNFVLAAIAGIGCTNALKLETTSTADLLAATEKKLSLDLKGGAKCMADNGITNLIGMTHGDLAVAGSNCLIDHSNQGSKNEKTCTKITVGIAIYAGMHDLVGLAKYTHDTKSDSKKCACEARLKHETNMYWYHRNEYSKCRRETRWWRRNGNGCRSFNKHYYHHYGRQMGNVKRNCTFF